MTDWKIIENDYKEGMSINELAQKYGVKANTIKGRKQRGKWKRNILDESSSNTKNNGYSISDDMYEKGYSIEDMRKILYPEYYEDDSTEFEEMGYMYAEAIFGDNENFEESDFAFYGKGYEEEYVRQQNVKNMIERIICERVLLGLGKKRKVTAKYNAQKVLVGTTVSNVIPTRDEQQYALNKMEFIAQEMGMEMDKRLN